MKILNEYKIEMNHFRFYLILLSLAIILSYSVYLMFSPETIASLGDEDHFFEWLSALSLLLGSILLFEVFRFSKNFYFLILAFVFFFGFGEEISWGQRLLHFKTPERIEKINIQKEFSIHNLELFNRSNLKGEEKHGWQRLLEFNFLFRISTILFGIIFPILVFHSKFVHWFAQKMRLPVPPLSIGLFFAFNWITFKIIHSYLLHPGHSPKYYSGLSEIFECMGIVIMLTVIFYFYTERRTIVTGNDFKQTR